LWEDGVQDAVRGLDWVNREDFDSAITAARKYYPEPPGETPPPSPPVPPTIHMAAAPEPQPSRLAAPTFDMHVESVPAKLRPVWRIRMPGDGRPDGQ
jgi:hypothetical protein